MNTEILFVSDITPLKSAAGPPIGLSWPTGNPSPQKLYVGIKTAIALSAFKYSFFSVTSQCWNFPFNGQFPILQRNNFFDLSAFFDFQPRLDIDFLGKIIEPR